MAPANRFEALAAPGVRDLKPYVPGKPIEELERELGISDSIKLASNENPLGPGPLARAARARISVSLSVKASSSKSPASAPPWFQSASTAFWRTSMSASLRPLRAASSTQGSLNSARIRRLRARSIGSALSMNGISAERASEPRLMSSSPALSHSPPGSVCVPATAVGYGAPHRRWRSPTYSLAAGLEVLPKNRIFQQPHDGSKYRCAAMVTSSVTAGVLPKPTRESSATTATSELVAILTTQA